MMGEPKADPWDVAYVLWNIGRRDYYVIWATREVEVDGRLYRLEVPFRAVTKTS